MVTDYEEVTGRTTAVQTVEIRPRVSGVLEQVFFTDGQIVTTTAPPTPLFQIDDRPYKAELARTNAAIEQARAKLDRLSLQEQRAKKLRDSNAIPEEQYEQILYDRAEAQAALNVAIAERDIAQLNVGYTRIAAPIAGRISRRLVDPGNLVKADETPLTTIVSLNPIYAYFDIDERTVLRLRRMSAVDGSYFEHDLKLPVQVALADDEDFPLKGMVTFADNQVDPNTGTLRARAVIDNPSGLLSSGLFVRIRVPIGEPKLALMIPEESLGTDQGQRFVYVVNEKNEVAYRRVRVGKLSHGRRVVEDGLSPSDRIVVNGLQRVRPGAKVTVLAPAGERPTATAAKTPADAATPILAGGKTSSVGGK